MTKADFFRQLELDSPHDYAKSRARKYAWQDHALWEIDHLPMVNLLHKTAQELQDMNGHVLFNYQIGDLQQIEQFQVVTLIAHWKSQQQQVEFSNGLFGIEQILDHIPPTFSGIFDLSICNSTFLQDALKKHCPSSLVVANKHATSLDFRIILYKTLIKMLNLKEMNYIDAMADLRIDLIRASSKRVCGSIKG
ncbi:MAG: hypothetical protein HRU41_24785 [Saprospiraceae bacterium]|nr:hypothetical protein [Saprospiraceae bacterium]